MVTVRAAKPKALVFADAAEVEIVRTSRDYPDDATKIKVTTLGAPSLGLEPPFAPSPLGLLALVAASDPGSSAAPSLHGQHLAAIALGTNLGDRFANIEAALRLLEKPELISASDEAGTASSLAVVNTSFLYETAPMYVTDQPSFLNCACIVRSLFLLKKKKESYWWFSHLYFQIRTTVTPLALLEILKNIERTVGRMPSIRNGPRAVDLDILFYDDEVIDTRPESLRESLEGLEGHLIVPHPRMAEREFVLRPLYESAAFALPFEGCLL